MSKSDEETKINYCLKYFFILSLALLGALSSGCTAPLLNSERIEARYGSYGVEVIAQTPARRISDLYSLDGDRRITRTHAMVLFAQPVPDALAAVHQDILAGASLGRALVEAGWRVRKTGLYVGSTTVPATAHGLARRMVIDVPARLALHVYRLDAVRGDAVLPYATVLELHHPDYLDQAGLVRIYGLPRDPAPGSPGGPWRRALETSLQY